MTYSIPTRSCAIIMAIASFSIVIGCAPGGGGGGGGNANDNGAGNVNNNNNDNGGGGGGEPVENDRVAFGADTGFVGPVTVAVGVVDWNGDGFPDVVTVGANTAGDDAGDVFVSLNDGAGAFGGATAVVEDAGLTGGSEVITADLDGAGRLEAIVRDGGSDSRDGGVLIVSAAGDGSGDALLLPGSTDRPFAVAAGDVTGDGDADVLVVIGEDADRLLIYAGNGDLTFAAPTSLDLPAAVGGIALADFDGDGALDLCMSLVASDSQTGLNQAGVMLGDGDGGFGDALILDAGLTPLDVAAADMNGDGLLDLVVGHALDSAYVFPGNGDGTFDDPVRADGASSTAFDIADIDGDGNPDLIGKAVGAILPRILYGDGEGAFPEFQELGFSATTAIADFRVADLNGDGLVDFVGVGTFVDTSGGGADVFEIVVKLRQSAGE